MSIVDRYVALCEELDRDAADPGRSFMLRTLAIAAHEERQKLWREMTDAERAEASHRRKKS